MKIYENGIIRELTPEEIAEFEAQQAQAAAEMAAAPPTQEERLAALESAMLEMIMGGAE